MALYALYGCFLPYKAYKAILMNLHYLYCLNTDFHRLFYGKFLDFCYCQATILNTTTQFE